MSSPSPTPQVPLGMYWFRRALRIEDNQGFAEAVASCQSVLPIFILDPAILNRPDTAKRRVDFLYAALSDLNAQLVACGGRLLVFFGKPQEIIPALVREMGVSHLWHARECEPHGRTRDTEIATLLAPLGCQIHTHEDHLLVSPDDIRTKTGGIYTVFTPFKNTWWEVAITKPKPAPERVFVPDLPDLCQPWLAEIPKLTNPDFSNAKEILAVFVKNAVTNYDIGRDFPAEHGTSRLSMYLKWGILSARTVYHAIQALPNSKGTDIFISELAWRDFYNHILFHFPHVETGAFKREYDTIAWENDEELFTAWCNGQTGYPIVDAAMRELNATGWMHNRARMIVASFLTKDLLCNWQWGEQYFMQELLDGDLAANNGGWQWAASTGTDAQPYFRIFNPVSQGEKFDPEGTYVKKWCPELSRIPIKYIHQPWTLSKLEQEAVGCVLGTHYPHRVVDHAVVRERALLLYKSVRV
jgi:deoxyribodipyrimidine photo-lyase